MSELNLNATDPESIKTSIFDKRVNMSSTTERASAAIKTLKETFDSNLSVYISMNYMLGGYEVSPLFERCRVKVIDYIDSYDYMPEIIERLLNSDKNFVDDTVIDFMTNAILISSVSLRNSSDDEMMHQFIFALHHSLSSALKTALNVGHTGGILK